MASFFHKPIEYLKGIGPEKAALINKELGYFNVGNLLQHYPFRYEDRTSFHSLRKSQKISCHLIVTFTSIKIEIQMWLNVVKCLHCSS